MVVGAIVVVVVDDVEVVVVVGAAAVVGTTSVVATAGTVDAATAIPVDGARLVSALEPVQPEKASAASSEPAITRQPSDAKRLPPSRPRRRCGREHLGLQCADHGYPAFGEVHQRIEFGPGERLALRRALHFGEAAVARHDDVHVDFSS